MSAQDKQRKDQGDGALPPSPAADADKSAAKPDAAKPGLKFVFKIAPADPKRNSIDFEDVADK